METNAIWLQVVVTVNAATRGSFTEADRSRDPWDVGYQSAVTRAVNILGIAQTRT